MGKGGGGGTTSTTSADTAYNARMANIAEAQQSMAQSYFDDWTASEKPLTNAQNAAALALVPGQAALDAKNLAAQSRLVDPTTNLSLANIAAQSRLVDPTTNLSLANIAAQSELLPSTTALGRETNKSQLSLLPSTTALGLATNQSQLALLPSTTALGLATNQSKLSLLPSATATTQKFLTESQNGVDANEWATRAGTDAKIQAANTQSALGRNASRLGLDPNSGAYVRAAQDAGTKSALGTAAAMTTSRQAALDENWKRLSAGATVAAGVI